MVNDREIRVRARWMGRELSALVDTGATTSLVAWDWWCRQGRPGHIDAVPHRITGADGSEIHVHGRSKGRFKVQDKSYQVGFVIADIDEEAILGMDFLTKHKVLIDTATQRLRFEAPEAQRIRLLRGLVIPPGEEVEVEGEIPEDITWEEAVVEGVREIEDKHGIRICRGVVQPEDGFVPVRVWNPGAESVYLPKYMSLAQLEESEGVTAEQEETEDGAPSTGKCRRVAIAPATQEKVEKLVENSKLTNRDGLRETLEQYADLFAEPEGPISGTDLVQHEIPTGDAAPIKQPPRRTAPHRRPLVAAEVQKMLDKEVIEPAAGPWASPVVLVRKKDGLFSSPVMADTKSDSFGVVTYTRYVVLPAMPPSTWVSTERPNPF